MAYVALYRKYRSQSFNELMGQEQVTVTLQNAIRSGRIAHAYLFYGARGCGKTSTARLLARALNCVQQDSPTPEPCGTCRICNAIREGNCLDVVEMDAASETGIDDVREKIIENVMYAPGEARYKVYIIDEVHDLSAKAFDALLKTLEEPPAHVVFILATTELHKVPITIRSRCMPYHFKRGTLKDLAAAVQRVIDAEGFSAEPEAIQAIARSAEGSWRDALSLLEQTLAYADGKLTSETVHRAIGTVGIETLAKVTQTLAGNDWSATLAVSAELVDSGKDVRQLFTALMSHLRDLLLIAAGANQTVEQEFGTERLEILRPQAAHFDPPTLLKMLSVLTAAEREIRFTNQHRYLLERTLLALMPINLITSKPAEAATRPTVERSTAAKPPHAPPVAMEPSVVPRPPTSPRNDRTNTPDSPIVMPPPILPQPPPTAKPATQPSNDTRFATEVTLEVIQRAWERILAAFRRASAAGAPFLEKATVEGLEGKVIVLGFLDAFARDRVQNNERGKKKVEQVINETLATEGYKIRCVGKDAEPENAVSPTPISPTDIEPTLLDAPPTLPATSPKRIADFEPQQPFDQSPNRVAEVATNDYATGNGESIQSATTTSSHAPNALLQEADVVFGGKIVHREPNTASF